MTPSRRGFCVVDGLPFRIETRASLRAVGGGGEGEAIGHHPQRVLRDSTVDRGDRAGKGVEKVG